ncbi:MAG TPA: hypothetical protein VGB54_04840, partial [Allosphingosinicella sp.]
ASLCAPGETPLFQCRIGSRRAAVCGGRSASGQAYAQYRYGRPGALELAYPATTNGGTGNMVRAIIPYSGGGEAQFHFTNEGHQYVVYSRMVRTRFDGRNNAPRFSAGIMVRRDGRTLADRACSDGQDANVDLGAAEPFIPEGEPVEAE